MYNEDKTDNTKDENYADFDKCDLDLGKSVNNEEALAFRRNDSYFYEMW